MRAIVTKTIMANAGARIVAIPAANGLALSSDLRKGRKWATSGAVASDKPDAAVTG